MKGILDLELGSEPLDRAKVDLAVAGFFADEFPLHGDCGRIDWRLCGLVSDQILCGRMRGERDEALLVPSSGSLRAQRVLILGLGSRTAYRLQQLAESVCESVSKAAALASPSLAVGLLGMTGNEFPRAVEALLSGAREGFGEAAGSMRLRIMLPKAELSRAAKALERAVDAMAEPHLRFRDPMLAPASSAVVAPESTRRQRTRR